jgi:hypothetical protein
MLDPPLRVGSRNPLLPTAPTGMRNRRLKLTLPWRIISREVMALAGAVLPAVTGKPVSAGVSEAPPKKAAQGAQWVRQRTPPCFALERTSNPHTFDFGCPMLLRRSTETVRLVRCLVRTHARLPPRQASGQRTRDRKSRHTPQLRILSASQYPGALVAPGRAPVHAVAHTSPGAMPHIPAGCADTERRRRRCANGATGYVTRGQRHAPALTGSRRQHRCHSRSEDRKGAHAWVV